MPLCIIITNIPYDPLLEMESVVRGKNSEERFQSHCTKKLYVQKILSRETQQNCILVKHQDQPKYSFMGIG